MEQLYKAYISQMEELYSIIDRFDCSEFDNVLSSIASSVENAQTMDSWIGADLHDIAKKLYSRKEHSFKINGTHAEWVHAFNVILGTCEMLQCLDDMEVYRAQMIVSEAMVL